VRLILSEIPLEHANHVTLSEFPVFIARAKTYARFKLAQSPTGAVASPEEPMTARSHRHSGTMRPARRSTTRRTARDREDDGGDGDSTEEKGMVVTEVVVVATTEEPKKEEKEKETD
jgi:hypothetical protein